MAIVVAVVALGGAAQAGPRIPGGVAWGHYELGHQQELTAAREPGERGWTLAGVRLDAVIGRRVGGLVGLELAAGLTWPAGFAYRANLTPLGVAVRIGATGAVGIGAGVGASGAVGTLDHGLDLPLTAVLEVPLGGRLRLIGRARATYLVGAPRRDAGAPHATWTDEVEAWLGVRWGRRYRDFGFASGNGTFVAVAYAERLGARWAGLILGYSIDLAADRR